MSNESTLIEPSHIGDGLYMIDKGYCVHIAANDHRNTVAVLDMDHIDRAIQYLQAVKQRIENQK